VDGPEQAAPQELPRIHERVLVCVPLPHFTEQALQAPYPPHLESTIAEPQDRVSVDGPEHDRPQELPRIQERVLVCIPLPHFTEQALQAPYPLHLESTIAEPQDRVSVDGPEHDRPQELPWIHERVLVCVPLPHFTEQALQAPYPLHLESTIAEPQDRVSTDGPEHALPQELPWMHERLLVWIPLPHFTEQALQPPYLPHLESTIAEPQDRVSTDGPEHALPQELPWIHERLLV